MSSVVNGNWDYKFTFSKQNSSFGEVMEEIFNLIDSENYINRYIGTTGQGEYIEILINEPEKLYKACKNYVVHLTNSYWNKYIILEFMKDFDNFEGIYGERFSFYVEY